MLQEITFYPILGMPLIVYGGVGTFLLFFLTAAVGYSNYKGIRRIGFKWHLRLAVLSLISGLFHGLLGLMAYL